MSLNLSNAISKIFGKDNGTAEDTSKKTATQQKVNTVFGTNAEPKTNTYNPFLKSNGELFNPYLNYQKILDNPNTADKAKKYITEATGLTPTTVDNTDYSVKSFANATGSQVNNNGIGFISAKYESGGNGGSVSSGNGDAGGVSYGVSQFSSKVGSADKFISWLKQTNPNMANAFKNYKAGTTEFSNAWKQTFSNYGEDFTNVQKQYTYDNYVKPLAELAKQKTGVDYTRSTALQELLYSTAIQFGSGSLGLSALGNVSAGMSDADIINASYDNKISNYKNYFKSSSANVQESVKKRFINERQDVLQLLNI